ncbi:hypothetical protein ACFLR8_01375 [Bacteroidota bacterium]
MRLALSIPVHEKSEVIIDQIININTHLDNPLIVLHFSKSFNWDSRYISKENFYNVIKSKPFVYVNPQNLETGFLNIFLTHISNFKYLSTQISFDYFCLHSSNDLFVKTGIEEIIKNHNAGFSWFNQTEKNDWYFPHAQKDKSLLKIMNTLKIDQIIGSQMEGSYYTKEIFGKIVNIIEQNYVSNKFNYQREEVYFPTIAQAFTNINVNHGKNYIFIPWNYDLIITIKDVKSVIKSDTFFGLKRINRQINNYLRIYIRNSIGNYHKELDSIFGIKIKSYNLIDLSISDLIQIIRKYLLLYIKKLYNSLNSKFFTKFWFSK